MLQEFGQLIFGLGQFVFIIFAIIWVINVVSSDNNNRYRMWQQPLVLMALAMSLTSIGNVMKGASLEVHPIVGPTLFMLTFVFIHHFRGVNAIVDHLYGGAELYSTTLMITAIAVVVSATTFA